MRHIVHDVVCRHILIPVLDRMKLFLSYTLSPPEWQGGTEGFMHIPNIPPDLCEGPDGMLNMHALRKSDSTHVG